MKEVIKYMARQLSRVAMVSAVVAAVLVPTLGAQAASDICLFGEQRPRQIVVNGNMATATFEIPKGRNNSCNRSLPYSLVAYTAPDASLRPLSSQKLFSSNIKHFTPGMHTISTPIPACGYFQVDLAKGMPIANLNDVGNSYASQQRLITAIGGGRACPAPAPAPAPAAPQAPAPQPPAPKPQTQPATVNQNVNENVNVNMQQQSQNVTVNVPQNPAAPAPAAPVAAAPVAEAPGKLANTGPASTAAIFAGVSGTSGLAYNLVMRRRNLG